MITRLNGEQSQQSYADVVEVEFRERPAPGRDDWRYLSVVDVVASDIIQQQLASVAAVNKEKHCTHMLG